MFFKLGRYSDSRFGRLRLEGVDVVDEVSVPHDTQTNGQAEAAVKLLKGLLRVHQLFFEL